MVDAGIKTHFVKENNPCLTCRCIKFLHCRLNI